MAVHSPARLMTVEEFRQMTEPAGEWEYELRRGELVQVPRPNHKHYAMQRRLGDLLILRLGSSGVVDIEVPFRALPEHELRAAGVGFVSSVRWNAIDDDDNLRGAPDLVIEVLSPSNTAAETYEREQLCLEHGARQFWAVDMKRRQVRVAGKSLPARSYGEDSEIPLDELGVSAPLAVREIFAS